MTGKKSEKCLSPFVVDELLRSEKWDVPAPDGARQHVESCHSCATRVSEAKAQEARFANQVVPRTLPSLQSERSGFSVDLNWRWALAGVTAAAAVALVLSLPSKVVHDATAPPGAGKRDPGYIGIKSAVGLAVYVKRGDKTFPLPPGTALRPGDRIRLLPASAEHDYLLVLYQDPAGEVQVVYPWASNRSGPLPQPGELLDDALLLDDTLGAIQIVGLFSDKPVNGELAAGWLRNNAALLPVANAIGGHDVKVMVLNLNKGGE